MTELLPGTRNPIRSADRRQLRVSALPVPGGGLSGVALAAADLLLGASCHSCGRPAVGVCADCRACVTERSAFLIENTRAFTGDPTPAARRAGRLRTAASSSYDPILRQLISAHKDRQAWQLTGFLGDRLGLAVQQLLAELGPEQTEHLQAVDGRLALVPVPSTAAAVRRRGRDATAALARRAAGRLDLDVQVVSGLRPVRPLADQSGLDARQRRANLAGALGVRTRRTEALRRSGVPVVLVDDLSTTGATLAEAARALGEAQVEVLGAAVIAVTQLRHPGHAG